MFFSKDCVIVTNLSAYKDMFFCDSSSVLFIFLNIYSLIMGFRGLFFSCLVLIYTVENINSCPHSTFIGKHMCQGSPNVNKAQMCAKKAHFYRVIRNLPQSKVNNIFIQSSSYGLKPKDFEMKNNVCQYKYPVSNFLCTTKDYNTWSCKPRSTSIVTHNPTTGHLISPKGRAHKEGSSKMGCKKKPIGS